MKVLIAYAGRNGSTEECVQRLSQLLPHHEVTLCDLFCEIPTLSSYDLCVVGGSVRFAKLQKPLRRFLKQESDSLRKMPFALFFLCGLPHEMEYYFDVLYDKSLCRDAFALTYFGGSLKTDGLKLFDKLMVKSLRAAIAESDIEDGEYTPTMPGILPENIEKLASEIRLQLSRIEKT